jgi:hypothetical protein
LAQERAWPGVGAGAGAGAAAPPPDCCARQRARNCAEVSPFVVPAALAAFHCSPHGFTRVWAPAVFEPDRTTSTIVAPVANRRNGCCVLSSRRKGAHRHNFISDGLKEDPCNPANGGEVRREGLIAGRRLLDARLKAGQDALGRGAGPASSCTGLTRASRREGGEVRREGQTALIFASCLLEARLKAGHDPVTGRPPRTRRSGTPSGRA